MSRRIRKAGFDFTDFPDAKAFKEFLKATKMKYLGAYRRKLGRAGSYLIYQWGNKEVLMGTMSNAITGVHGDQGRRRHPNQKGYCGSIGIKGKPKAVAKVVREIKKRASEIKDYDPRQLQFMGVGADPRRKKRTKKRKATPQPRRTGIDSYVMDG